MNFLWLACIIAGAAAMVWATGILMPHQRQQRSRDALQAMIILVAFLLMILGFLYGVQGS